MGASRLPGKVLLPLPINNTEETALSQLCKRVHAVSAIDKIIIATTTNAGDDELVAWVQDRLVVSDEARYVLFRGSEQDVLARYYHAAIYNQASVIVRLTADCPCMDTALLADMIEQYQRIKPDYLANTNVRQYPHGLDVEIFSFSALQRAYNEAKEPYEREHVTPYIYKSGKFNCVDFLNPQYQAGEEKLRVTLDTREDYVAIAALYSLLGESFTHQDIVNAFAQHPWLAMINENVVQKKFYDSEVSEIADAIMLLKRQDMHRAAAMLRNT
jgi:spore coat polysaccharide biosynthesis protein SpsF